jgi:hypothetical protein
MGWRGARRYGFTFVGFSVAALAAFRMQAAPESVTSVPSVQAAQPIGTVADTPSVRVGSSAPAADRAAGVDSARAAVAEAIDARSDPEARPAAAELETRTLLGPEESARSADEVTSSRPESSGEPERRWRRNRYRYPGPIPTPAEWEPPAGPVKIALQVGHWRADEAPDELRGLRGNGTRWEDIAEWQANMEIAHRAGVLLEELGYAVEILPAVVPPGYRAHLFISIHADGSPDPRASGYRVASPRRDATGRAQLAAELMEEAYGEATGLPRLPTVTRRMRSYYAFNFRRYEHALHPMTIAIILETGFLTSERDRRVIVDDPDRAAAGIAAAVVAFPETPPPRLASDPEDR